MKKCSSCGIEKELSEFHFKKGDKRQGMCKSCKKIYIRKHYKDNIEKYKEKARLNVFKAKSWLKEFKKGLKCERCGENHIACLDFHHVDKNTKEGAVSQLANSGLNKLLKEIDKCIVLCANCHRKEHYKDS